MDFPQSPSNSLFLPPNCHDPEAGTEIDREYTLDGEVQQGGMSTIRFGLSSVGERVVIKFFGNQTSYRREGLGPRVNTSNIIRMIEYIDPEEKDDLYLYSIVVLECGEMSLLSWAASSNRRPVEKNYLKMIIMDIISGLEAMKKVGLGHWAHFIFRNRVGSPVTGGTMGFCAPEVIAALHHKGHAVSDYPMDMFSLGQIIHWMSTLKPIWGMEEASEAQMRQILLSEEEFDLDPEDYNPRPLYHVLKDLLCKDPFKRLSLEDLKAKSYISGDLHTKSFAGVMQSWQKEPVAIKEDEHGEWIIPDHLDGPLASYASYVRHKDCRRLWALSGWGRRVSKGTLLDALKQHLAADALVQEVLGEFFYTHFPDEEGSKPECEEQLISIDEVNKVFPKESVDVSMGDWILYLMYKPQHCRMYCEREIEKKIMRIKEATPVRFMVLHSDLTVSTSDIAKSYERITKVDPINQHLSSRVLKALDNATLGYYTPEPKDDIFLQLLELIRQLISIIYLANNIMLYDPEVDIFIGMQRGVLYCSLYKTNTRSFVGL
ncbi:MAG: kinase-like domain-containing protein [Piptocephalis tieghemiana]|nr:MAG: kinase-like domain-containing protein [Piptocephalis tieghemiana]